MIVGPTKTLGIKPSSTLANRERIRRSIENSNLPTDLSDTQVIIDWSGAYGVRPTAIDETLLALIQDRSACELIFWVMNENLKESIARIAGHRDYLEKISIYNLSNIEVE